MTQTTPQATTPMSATSTSTKLTLAIKLSVLMMSVYVLFGGDAARPDLAAGFDPQIHIAAKAVPAFPVVLAQVGTRHILY